MSISYELCYVFCAVCFSAGVLFGTACMTAAVIRDDYFKQKEIKENGCEY